MLSNKFFCPFWILGYLFLLKVEYIQIQTSLKIMKNPFANLLKKKDKAGTPPPTPSGDKKKKETFFSKFLKNKLGKSIIKKLKIYSGSNHPHESQNPSEWNPKI